MIDKIGTYIGSPIGAFIVGGVELALHQNDNKNEPVLLRISDALTLFFGVGAFSSTSLFLGHSIRTGINYLVDKLITRIFGEDPLVNNIGSARKLHTKTLIVIALAFCGATIGMVIVNKLLHKGFAAEKLEG